MVLPEDLESFAQTSKHVFLLSKPLLKEHRSLIRLYTRFKSYALPGQERHTSLRDGFSVGLVPTLFRDVLNEPRIGHYIRRVEFDGILGQTILTTPRINSVEVQALYRQQRDLVDAAVAQSLVPQVRDQYQRFKDGRAEFMSGGEDLLIALLLPLLPNLNNLSIYQWAAKGDSYLSNMIQHGARVGTPWLKSLTTVHLCDSSAMWLWKVSLFNWLPSLKTLTALRVSDDPKTKDEYLLPQDSHTTDLMLYETSLSSRSLHWYLESFQNLQEFTVEYVPTWDELDEVVDFTPSLIRSTLMAHAKATLQTLTILGPTNSDPFMGSLQAFEALRDIRTEYYFLFPSDCDPETQPSRVLPASLHRLQLCDHEDRIETEYKAFFRGVQHAKTEACLHLQDVTVKTKGAKYAWRQSWSAGREECL